MKISLLNKSLYLLLSLSLFIGFFIGLHTKSIKRETLNKLVNILLKIDNI